MIRRVLSAAVALMLFAGMPAITLAQDAKPEAEKIVKKLAKGDKAPKLEVAKWVKGNEIKEFEKGKVYVVEFWATWCGPCKQSIPHLTELAHKYKEKVTVIGASVWEQNDQKNNKDYAAVVSDFVKTMGDKMDYNVCYDTKSGSDGAMATNWLKAAGQRGIPAAFIVDGEGKIAWIGHPMKMDKPLAEVLGEKVEMSGEEMQTAAMDVLAQFEATLRRDEAKAIELARKAADGEMKDNSFALNAFAWELMDESKFKKGDLDLAYRLATRAVELTKNKDGMVMDTLALAEFKKGNVDKAIELQAKAMELFKGSDEFQDDIMDEMKDRLEEFKAAKK
jgi:thiol-disulfide isomerase/thioredoxin